MFFLSSKQIDLSSSEYFINRDWSWLEFNNRVLYEAKEKSNPILERLKFISIVTSNLEEFFMVRVAGLKQLLKNNLKGSSPDKKNPTELLSGIRSRVLNMIKNQYSYFYDLIIPELNKNNIHILTDKKDLEKYKKKLKTLFNNDILPVLTPLSVSPTHPFPHLISGRLYLACNVESIDKSPSKIEKCSYSFVEIPVSVFGRFFQLDDNSFVPLESIIKLFIDKLYNGYKIISSCVIKVTRDADFSIEEDAISDLLSEMESTIKRMHIRNVIKLEYEKGITKKLLNEICSRNDIQNNDVYCINGMLNLDDLMDFYLMINRPDIKDEPLNPIDVYNPQEMSIFKYMNQNDFVLYHPYHSYQTVIELIKQAADDPDVLAIKQLLYRASSNSQIIKALIKAAENGKHVTVVVELKARFDEKRNIEWAKRLEEAGAYVIYGIAGLKTHAKALMIVRNEKNGIKRYIHLATGNYNELTAKLYTDLSLFTVDEVFGNDISGLFNLLTGFSLPIQWNNVTIAPLDLRNKFISLIRREIDNANKGITSKIIVKINSLSDKGIVELLYEASCAGVEIELIVRGICIAIPGIKNVSKNINVRSIIGRYLEHARIYYFHNGGNSELYLSSADWMTRNLDNRVELLFPVQDSNVKKFIEKIYNFQFKDNVNSWIMKDDCSYQLIKNTLKSSDKHSDSFKNIFSFIKKNYLSEKPVKTIFKPIYPVKSR